MDLNRLDAGFHRYEGCIVARPHYTTKSLFRVLCVKHNHAFGMNTSLTGEVTAC